VYRLGSVLGHVLRVLTVGLPRLLEDRFCVCVDEVRPLVVLLQILAHLTAPDHINVVCFLPLSEELATTSFDLVLELLVKRLQLLVTQVFKGRHFAQVLKHFVFFSDALLSQEFIVIFICQVEQVRVLGSPNGCEAPAHSHLFQMLLVFVGGDE